MTPTHIDYIPMSPLATAVRHSMYPTEHGGGAKKAIGIIAMIAVPMVAPAISMSIGLSGAIGSTLGGALTGAVLGGVASAATGGDWKRGALIGGLSGGIAGYMSTPGMTMANDPMAGGSMAGGPQLMSDVPLANTAAEAAAFQGGYSAPVAGATTAQGSTFDITSGGGDTFADALSDPYSMEYADAQMAALDSPAGYEAALGDSSVGITTPDFAGHPGYTDPSWNNAYTPTSYEVAQATTQVATQPVGMKTPVVKQPPVDESWGGKFKAGVKSAFTPEKMGEAAVKGLGNMLVDSAVGTSYNPEQQQLIDSRQAEVTRLEAQGAEVDAIKLAEAKKLLRQAMNVDPTYLGRQAANLAKNQAGRATGEAVRRVGAGGRQQELANAVERRGGLTGGKFAASAFDRGYQGGLKEKLALQDSGVNMLPDSKGLSAYYTSLGTQYTNADEARNKERDAYKALFGTALV